MIRPVLTAMLGLLPALALGQDKGADQAPAQPDILVRVEWIEVPHATLTTLMADQDLLDGTKLRMRLQELVKAGKAEIWDTAMVTTKVGQRADTQSYREWIYPTEQDVSEGGPVGGAAPDLRAKLPLVVPSAPAAFESRNVGVTLEVEPEIRRAGNAQGAALIDVRIAPEQIRLLKFVEHAGWKTKVGVASIKRPEFEVMRSAGQLVVRDGSYALLGVVQRKEAGDKRMLLMVRCDLLE